MQTSLRLLRLACLFPLSGSLLAQEPEPQRVFVLGASVSAGVVLPAPPKEGHPPNRSFTLKETLRFAWPDARAKVYSAAQVEFFRDPAKNFARQLSWLKKRGKGKVDLVLGIDLPFWFGYGWFGGDLEKQKAARLASLERGLKMIETIQAPLLLGDFPDMQGADRTFLHPAMVPHKDILAALNKRLRAWAGKRDRVHVMPLSGFTDKAKQGPLVLDWQEGEQVRFPSMYLLQTDRLHANRPGVLVLTHLLLAELPTLLGKAHPLCGQQPSLAALFKAAGQLHQVPKQEGPEKGAVRK